MCYALHWPTLSLETTNTTGNNNFGFVDVWKVRKYGRGGGATHLDIEIRTSGLVTLKSRAVVAAAYGSLRSSAPS